MPVKDRALPRWWRPVGITWLVVAIGLTGYWWASDAGLYRWLVDLQGRLFGAYSPELTFAVVVLALIVPALGIMSVVSLATGGRAGYRPPPAETAAANRWLAQNGAFVMALAFIAGGLIAGGYFLGRAWLAGPLTTLDLARLYGGEDPPSRYVEVTGRALTGEAIDEISGERGSEIRTLYFPLVPERSEFRERRLIVGISNPSRVEEVLLGGEAVPATVRGILGGLPDGLRERLERNGVSPAADAWVLDEGESPEALAGLGTALLASLVGLGTVIGVVGLAARRRSRRAAEEIRRGALPPPGRLRFPVGGVRWPNRCIRCGTPSPVYHVPIDCSGGVDLLLVSLRVGVALTAPACGPCRGKRLPRKVLYYAAHIVALIGSIVGSALLINATGIYPGLIIVPFVPLWTAWLIFLRGPAHRAFDRRYLGVRAGLEPDHDHLWIEVDDPGLAADLQAAR